MYRYAARILELKREGYEIKAWHDEDDRQKYWYQIVSAPDCVRGDASPERYTVQKELV